MQDEDWMGHTLVFRKDATLDRRALEPAPTRYKQLTLTIADTIDEYVSIDPLSKNTLSLDELKVKSDNSGRKYPTAKEDGDRRGGGSGRGGGGANRGGGGFRDRGRDERGDRGGGFGGGDRRERNTQFGDDDRGPAGRSTSGASWKTDRVNDLA